MRAVITGSRSWPISASDQVWDRLDQAGVTYLGVGDARGVDAYGRSWANTRLRPSEYHVFEADWVKYGTSAGPIRNRAMLTAVQPGILLAFLVPEKPCRGTWHCIEYAQDVMKIPVRIYRLRPSPFHD